MYKIFQAKTLSFERDTAVLLLLGQTGNANSSCNTRSRQPSHGRSAENEVSIVTMFRPETDTNGNTCCLQRWMFM